MASEPAACHKLAIPLLILTLASLGCGDSVDPSRGIRVVPDRVAIDPGESLALELQRDAGAPDGTAVWESLDPEIASVSQDGVVTGLASGFALIMAQVGEEAAGSAVAVIGPLSRVELLMDQERLEVGDSVAAQAIAFDIFGLGVTYVESWRPGIQFPNTPFEWTSSDSAVVTVAETSSIPQQTAMVNARHPGTAVVTVSFGGMTDTAEIVVGADSLSFVAETLQVEVDRAALFELERHGFPNPFVPSDSVTLSVADPSVAELLMPASSRVVVGKREGTTTVTASHKGLSASAVVIVAGQPERFVSVASVFAHTCGTYDDGRLYCWGGRTLHVPSLVPAPAPLRAIWGRFGHMCGIDFGGSAWCWGGNTFGQLGTGDMQSSDTPARVAGGIRFTELAAGGDHTCGLATDGTAYCWGKNHYGQLGTGSAGTSVPVPTPVAGDEHFVSISAGGTHTCATTATAAAYCWGWGDGLRSMGLPTAPCATEFGETDCTPAPSRVQALLGFSQIEAGSGRTCAVMTEGSGYCWGQIYGAPDLLGPNRIPAQVELVEVALTRQNHLCGIAAGGSVYCWVNFIPELLAGVIPFESLAGGEMLCGIGSDGAYCGGQNFLGRIEELKKVFGQP